MHKMHKTRKIESKHAFGLTSRSNCSLTFLRTADAFELRLVPNCCGGMSLVYEDRAYKLKYASPKRAKCWGCSKPRPLSHQQQASIQYLNRSEMQCATNGRNQQDLEIPNAFKGMKSGLLATNVAWAQTVHSRFYQNGINNCSLAMPLQWGIFRIRGYRAAISTSAKRYIGKSVSWAWKRDIKPKKKQK
ncbi:hypothetical protein T07_7758 [Trichinella nelsoni]|uniref:FLYWCH-type domain-containing protein n=1 Tax=Trichinella nelsoni TaxID=6336 RepID=A0A0V0S419_9BILA|nr:hypothetical protein T07_7758 [Trichinella nelsoni]